MKKASKVTFIAKPLAIAAVLTCACASAQAQSNVTIYGRITQGINYQSNQPVTTTTNGSKWGVDGGVWGTSMFGVKGTEDLGGGLVATFNLETGFDGSTGKNSDTAGQLWTRRSTVGLVGSAGTLKIGHDLALPSDVVWALDPTGQQNLGSATLVKGRNWPNEKNQINYTTPSFGGFTAQGVYGFGEVAGSTKSSSTSGLSLAYVQSNYELRAIYDTEADGDGNYSSLFKYSKELTVGGTVTLDKLKLYAAYQHLSAPGLAASTGNPDKADHYWIGANYQLTSALTLIGAAYHVKLNQGTGSANLFMLGTNYALSKRTIWYTSIGTVRNSALTSFAVEVGDSNRGVNQNAFYTGIAHSF
jgi:predicted porin